MSERESETEFMAHYERIVEEPSVQRDDAENPRTSRKRTRGDALDYEKVQTFESLSDIIIIN